MKKAKPFLKWAGGKTQLLEEISLKIPYKKNDRFIYVEPFVGSGAVLFWVLNHYPNLESVVINDINEDLINTYKVIKENCDFLVSILEKWEGEYHAIAGKQEVKKEYYHAKRSLFNTRKSDKVTQTALFIFLNKTCYNGLYRVNKKNKFNVPIGSYKKPMICDRENLKAVSHVLQKVEILNGDFEKTVDYAKEESFFYFDPPYKPLSKTSNFNSYAKDEFNDIEQIRLKEFCDSLNSMGCKWMLSNSDVKGENPEDNFFDDLFEKYQINRVMARRSINANSSKRGLLTELLIAN
ncbi:MAG: DNA adenine methylase [Thiomargarita sp.]|nr:DNA adenine methylase [Thiomargarita sp.]